ncbi:hypothetical protein HC081234_13840 [Helicobacter cinaedi]|nr:hypothetical protein HC081234_13840 [Helicobacter cinaedi]
MVALVVLFHSVSLLFFFGVFGKLKLVCGVCQGYTKNQKRINMEFS